MKNINICGKEYNIDGNAYTYLQFKNVFKRDLFEDIQILKEFFTKQTEKLTELQEKDINQDEIEKELNKAMLNNIGEFVEAITRLTYIFIYTVDDKIIDYKNFMKAIPKLSIDDDWVVEVTEFAVEKFC